MSSRDWLLIETTAKLATEQIFVFNHKIIIFNGVFEIIFNQ